MQTVPADIVNRALDAIGAEHTVGDLQEGTREAAAALRIYGPMLRQLLRGAHWNFARKQAQLTLLQDATGNTTNAQKTAGQPVTVGTGTYGMGQWIYEYQWPTDGVKARYLPVSQLIGSNSGVPGNIGLPATPLMTGLGTPAQPPCTIPARFLVTQDNVPPQVGALTSWAAQPDLPAGQGPAQQTVVLTNQPNATLVYTGLVTYPDEWDALFQQAFVAVLASHLAMAVLPDKKFALALRGQQIAIAKAALDEARRIDGDEGWTTTDHTPDWMRVRNSGSRWGAAGLLGDGAGVLGYGWDQCGFGDGSAY